MRVLLIDDSRKHREAGVADLVALGHEVVALGNYTDVAKTVREQKFDVALLDLLMPAEPMMLGGEGLSHLGEPFAVGYPLAVYLAMKSVPLVAVATDANHHNHPASAMMDWLCKESVTVNGCSVTFMHSPMKQIGDVWVKDWPAVLTQVGIRGKP